MSLFTFKGCLRSLLAVFPLFAMGGMAQTSGSGTSLIRGVESLPGIDPTNSEYWETNTDYAGYSDNAPGKTFFLYNVGTGKFVNMGGAWGTHAALHTTPKYFFLFNNVPRENDSSPVKLNFRTKQYSKEAKSESPEKSTDYMQLVGQKAYNNTPTGVYLDGSYDNHSGGQVPEGDLSSAIHGVGWQFEKASDYSAQNQTYKIYQTVDGQRYYLMAKEPDEYGGDVSALVETAGTTYNDVWKIISLSQYYELFNQAAADLTEPTDASFLLMDPDFSVNNRYLNKWNVVANPSTDVWFGTSYLTKKSNSSTEYNYTTYEGLEKGGYQLKYGRFCNAMIHAAQGEVWQGVQITKPGWFIFRCRGISNANAVLYAEQCTDNTYSTVVENEYSTQALNAFPSSVLSASDKMLQAGKEFATGKYDNQVMLYIAPKENVSAYYIRFGVKAAGASSAKGSLQAAAAATTEKMTIFDTFRMLYAGKTTDPELILDEDNTDLYYLTPNEHDGNKSHNTPGDTYVNTTLHLKRAFTLNKWNTIVLPVSLTRGQMKNAFGDDVRLAYLWKVTDNTMRFLTVERESDNDTMLVANKPYIIYPTKSPGTTQAYTATLHHKRGTTTEPQENWIGTYQGNEVNSGEISIEKDHYQIAKVTLNLDNVSKDTATWVSTTVLSASLDSKGTLKNLGTLAKTYDGSSIISGRNDCSGAYVMKGGKFYLVPSGKQYGLKAFRTWFEYTPAAGSAKPSVLLFSINGVTDTTTDIDDLFADEPAGRPVAIPGVYSLSGQRLRNGNDLTGLPSGIYIVNGKKYVVK